jgi:hypothetical protein
LDSRSRRLRKSASAANLETVSLHIESEWAKAVEPAQLLGRSNNTGLAPRRRAAGSAAAVTVQISAISNSTAQPPITITDLGPGLTASISQVLTALQIPAGTETTVLLFAGVVSGGHSRPGLPA